MLSFRRFSGVRFSAPVAHGLIIMGMKKPRILVARAIFPEVLAKLAEHFEVTPNPSDAVLTPDQLVAQLQGMQGVFTTGSERIDAPLLSAWRLYPR